MKLKISILLILVHLIILTGCKTETATLKDNSYKGVNNLVRENTVSILDDNTNKNSQQIMTKGSIKSSSFDIIAESGNSISSDDKEKVIKKLDDELGTLFDSINSLEDK